MSRVVEDIRFITRDHRAFDLVGESAEVVVPLRNVSALSGHFADELAVVAHFERREFLGMLGEQIAKPAQQGAALGRGQSCPFSVRERGVRGVDCGIRIRFVTTRDLGPGLRRVRINRLEIRIRARRDTGAIDVGVELRQFSHVLPPRVPFSV